jgi:hypothetical protein
MRLPLLLFFVLFLNKLNAQTEQESNTTVIAFDDSKSSDVKKNKKGKIIHSFSKNNVKIGLLGPVFGEVPFYYERYIADFFTIQVGVGVTTRDFLGDLYRNITFGRKLQNSEQSNNWTANNQLDESDNDGYQYKSAGIGFCVSLAPRFFPGGDAFDGFYVAPYVEYATRTNKIQKVDINGNRLKNDKFTETTSSIVFLTQAGWQHDYDPVTLDWSVGLGFARNQYKKLDIGYTFDEVTYDRTYGNKEKSYAKINMYFKVNLDLGFTFGKKKKKKSN